MTALKICSIKIYLFVQQTWKEGVSTLVLSGRDWERCRGLPGVLDSTVWSPASERTDNPIELIFSPLVLGFYGSNIKIIRKFDFYCKIGILSPKSPESKN